MTYVLLEATASADPVLHDRIISSMSKAETMLETNADTAGGACETDMRLFNVPPLSLKYRVNIDLQEVLVVEARVQRGRK